jgi:hypothetical protein
VLYVNTHSIVHFTLYILTLENNTTEGLPAYHACGVQ